MFDIGFPRDWSSLKKLIWLKAAISGGGASAVWKTGTGALIHLTDALASPMRKCEVTLEPIQDLHGQDAPYPAGGGKNIAPISTWSGHSGAVSGMTLSIPANTPITFSFVGTVDTGTHQFSIYFIFSDNTTSGWASFTPSTSRQSKTSIFEKDVVGVGFYSSSDGWSASQNVTLTITDFQIELGETATPYSPYENICPITGWTGCEVNVTGKNLYMGTKSTDRTVIYGGKNNHNVVVDEDYSFKAGTYRLSCTVKDMVSPPSLFVSQKVGGVWTSPNNKGQVTTFTFTVPENCEHYEIWGYGGNFNGFENIQIELGSASATDYEAPRGTTLSVTFPDGQTVYGGTVDLVSGVLTVDTQFIELDGTETGWTKYGNTDMLNGNLAINTLTTGGNVVGISSHIDSINDTLHPQKLTHLNAGRGLQFRQVLTVFGLPNNEVTTWTAFLAEQKANGTPIQIVTYLQTPITYQLTPQEISTLKGENNVWGSGDLEITYKAQA